MAPSHLPKSFLAAGSAASQAEVNKRAKYSALSHLHAFTPVAIETFGAWGEEGRQLITELGARITILTGEPRSTLFLRQQIDIALQRGNVASILGSLPWGDGWRSEEGGCWGQSLMSLWE